MCTHSIKAHKPELVIMGTILQYNDLVGVTSDRNLYWHKNISYFTTFAAKISVLVNISGHLTCTPSMHTKSDQI